MDPLASNADLTVVVLAAGKGTRMKSERPKVLHELCGRSMLGMVLGEARRLEPARVVVVVGAGAEQVEAAARAEAGEDLAIEVVVQEPQNGTGHAVQVAMQAVPEGPGRVVVLYGDMPLLRAETMVELLEAQESPGLALLTMYADDPRGYGRIVRDAGGNVCAIVEDRDCTPEQRQIDEINLGVYAFDAEALRSDLPRLDDDNAQGELYLTDVLALTVGDGRAARTLALSGEDTMEGLGVNNLSQLAEVREVAQMRILEEHMARGVNVIDPATTYIDHGVEIGRGTTVLPCTYIHAGVRVGEGCEVGPFTHLRPGTVLEDGAEVGNFTECKNSTLGAHSKAKHLSYLGDATVGERANIGAGTIFANYDGKAKHKSIVGDGAFVGSGTIIVAPNEVPAGSTTGAGAVVTRSADMQEGETWVGLPARRLRSPQPEPEES